MTQLQGIRINDRVRVTRDIGDLAVQTGDVGVVCSIFRHPTTAYEVEFHQRGSAFGLRTVIFHEQLEAVTTGMPEMAA
jgi:hypothetical protein